MLRHTLGRTFWSVYDALGRLIVANILWFLFSLPALGFLYLLLLPFRKAFFFLFATSAIPVLFLNPGRAALAEMSQRLVETGDTDFDTFFVGFRAHFFRSMLLMSVGVLLAMVLGASVVFYGGGVLTQLGRWGNVILAGFTVWVAVILAGMACYWMPIAVGVPGKSPRIGFILKRAALLTLDNPGFTLGVLLTTAVATFFWAATGLGLLVLGMSFISVFHAEARRTLRERYDVAERLATKSGTVSRREVTRALQKRWARGRKRHLRELFRPWDVD